MKKFVKVQQDILDSVAKNQLVSAGAGSGKTTVMIEKISNLILLDNVPVESLLVVTFTVLAAEEMRLRLIEKLNNELSIAVDKERILDIIEKIKTASIDTIDGFASKTIKKYFYELSINPNIEIVSDTTKDYYLSKAMKQSIHEFSQDVNKINILIDIFGGNKRNLDNIENLILDTYNKIINLEDYDTFLNNSLNEYLDSVKSEQFVNNVIINKINNIKSKITVNYIKNSEINEEINKFIKKLDKLNKNISLKSNLLILNNIIIPKFSTKEIKDNVELKEVLVELNKFDKFLQELKNAGIDENFEINNEKIHEYFKYYIELVRIFIKNYNFIKEKNNFIDFNDLNRLMLRLLRNDKVRAELSDRYRYIFIDEYQDVNPLQDSIMSKLVDENTNLFCVGDVKQSIYGFRGASPEWFLKKYDDYKANDTIGKAFDMNVNFRSNPLILQFVNTVFSQLMTREEAEIDYLADSMIDPKREDIIDSKVKILLVDNTETGEVATGIYSVANDNNHKIINTKTMEAFLVLNEITKLVGTKFYDANLKEERLLRYSDIAILSRSDKDEDAKILIEILKKGNIPLKLSSKLDVKSSEVISLIMSILKVIANMADDVDYLTVFMSSIAGLNVDDIVKVRIDKTKSFYENLNSYTGDRTKIELGFKNLEDIKIASYTKSNSQLIRYICNDKKLKFDILSKPHGGQEYASLTEFLNKISTIEDSLNLAEFIEVVESNIGKGGDYETSDSEDSVILETIHKSKGLEYPVVILYNSSKMFNYIRGVDAIAFNNDIGLGVDYYDTENRVKTEGLVKFAIKLKNRDKGYKEEMRLLYVAMTRAKNKLIITGEKLTEIKKTSFMGMILSCFPNYKDKKEFDNCIIDVIENPNSIITLLEDDGDIEEYEDIKCDISKLNIPIKNTVTAINSARSETLGFDTKRYISSDEQLKVDEDRAIIGTHYHTALEHLDYMSEYIQNTDFKDVDYAKIEQAYVAISNLCVGANNVRKESEFVMYLPYNELVTDSNISDKVLVQGVVDLIIEFDNHIVIVDYKFSRYKASVLKRKYSEQLKLYKLAVEKAYKKPVTGAYIFSINTGELA